MSRIKAVIFDLGGVVLSSPVEGLRNYATSKGLPELYFAKIIIAGGEQSPFERLERGEITILQFADEFEKECAQRGQVVDGKEIINVFKSHPRPEWLQVVDAIRAGGLKTGVITNNWSYPEGSKLAQFYAELATHFDVMVESCKVGIRKPSKRIYEIALERLSLLASDCIYLDDLGFNLKVPKEMGMITIRVHKDHHEALRTLQSNLPFPVLPPSVAPKPPITPAKL